jgi:hypothetical protein
MLFLPPGAVVVGGAPEGDAKPAGGVLSEERVGALLADASLPARRLLRRVLADRARDRPVHVQVVGDDELGSFASDGLGDGAVERRELLGSAVVGRLQAVVDDSGSFAGGRRTSRGRYIRGVLSGALRGLCDCVPADRAHLEAGGHQLADNSSPDAAAPTEDDLQAGHATPIGLVSRRVGARMLGPVRLLDRAR